jgi:hypothetical protein
VAYLLWSPLVFCIMHFTKCVEDLQ